ncbi:hypothetical protein CEP51_001172 [Fusarium floridanum]|uniref:NB-ARC domain-containing protein n=1 Tax=Fusarium floridanum TaxID=1325733 RepID=A0A428SIH1_9HYPO|nr:hypothetical protein CEP51_001172 [Fusarium floridanum]
MADISRVFSKEDLVLVRIRSVADPEYLRQSRSYQVSDCETMMTEVRKAFEARKVSPLLDQFEKPLHIIDQFVKGMTVLVQALDPIAQIIWGGFLIVFKNVVRFVDLIGTISACFDTLSNTLARSFLLHGLGGVGKTQLAAHFAYTHWDDYDIIIWAVADTEQSLDDHFLQAAAALGLPHEGDASAIVTNVMNWLTDCNHNWLIIFDNVDNESLLLRFWPKSAKGSILLTSRQRLLGTTMVDGACEVSSLEKEDGASMIQLLLENEVSDAQDRHLVEEMAKALGGLPLALAQMAGYLRTNHVTVREFLGNYNNSEYARRLFGRPASLDHEQHQQTLETVWRLSLEKLSADAKTLLWITVFLHPDEMPCSIFQIRNVSPGRPLLPALQVLDTSHNTLQYKEAESSLTKQSLVTYNEKELSLSIHRLVQQSALYQLLDGDPGSLRVAVSGAVHVLYHAYPRQCPLGKPIPNWPACQQYTTHVLHLLDLYETEKKVREIADINTLTLFTELLCDCGVYLWARCLFGDAERLARASIEVAERVLEPHDCLRAQPYTLLGCICIRAGNRREEAVKSLETALHIRKENMQIDYKDADPPLHIDIQLANAYSNLGIVAKQMGEFARAAKLYEQAIEIKERQRDHCAGFLLALSLHNVGKLHCLQGRVEEAVKFFRECQAEMSIYQDDDEMKARQAVWLCSLAEAEASLGHIEDAEAHFSQSLETLKKVMEGSLDAGMACLRFGIFRYGAGRFEEALALFNDAERIFSVKPTVALDQQIVSKNRLAYCLHWLGRTYAQLGQESDSEEAQSRASELYVGITGKETSVDPEKALEGYGRLVSDD